MAHLFDSNCFLRPADSQTAARRVVLGAIRKLRTANEAIFYTPQIVAEFWNVCTRPTSARGGLGLSVKQTELKVKVIEKHFRLLPDNLATFIEWRGPLSTHTVEFTTLRS